MTFEFDSVEEAMAWIDAWARANTPTQVRADLVEFEAAHLEQFLGDYGRGYDQFYILFGELVALVDQVNFIDRTAWPPHRGLQFVTIAKNLKPFHSAMDRLSKGSYQDALTLVRSLYDAFLRVIHVSLYSENPWGALVSKPAKGVPTFNATGLVQTELRLDWLANYALMSVFAHGNVFEISQSLIRNEQSEGDPERFGLTYEDDVKLVELVLPYLQLLLLLNLRFVRECLIGSAEAPDPDRSAAADTAIGVLTWMIGKNPKPFWEQTTKDVDFIFDLIAVADTGGDWRAMRNLRPEVPSRGSRNANTSDRDSEADG